VDDEDGTLIVSAAPRASNGRVECEMDHVCASADGTFEQVYSPA
jgi:hypothetical protein